MSGATSPLNKGSIMLLDLLEVNHCLNSPAAGVKHSAEFPLHTSSLPLKLLKLPAIPQGHSHQKSHANHAGQCRKVDAVCYKIPCKRLQELVDQAAPVSTSLDTDVMHGYTSGYIGKECVAPEAAGCTWSLEELVGTSSRFKFAVIPADASSGKVRPIVDASKCVSGAVIPPPRAEDMDEPDPTFLAAADECTALLKSNQPKLFKH
ncbi:hypothetical protein BT96DRAFT_1006011 [Gymnopus androsaceus JB14]|uniref:Uncharacterized protein n=1 Tax=Gymnopus androsaceus JB14 TaxID=1447944 RepID=A0A6A4GM22_9AGAR|nr:hypothetical protein BT96DRAFT_1006011 [Gymnopus androsaceus JB14]